MLQKYLSSLKCNSSLNREVCHSTVQIQRTFPRSFYFHVYSVLPSPPKATHHTTSQENFPSFSSSQWPLPFSLLHMEAESYDSSLFGFISFSYPHRDCKHSVAFMYSMSFERATKCVTGKYLHDYFQDLFILLYHKISYVYEFMKQNYSN